MERHIAKRLGIPCAVISAPVHVQDFPARYSPQMGFEGANVLFDTWVHPLMMGLEEHLLAMFREDFEFHDDAAPSHLGGVAGSAAAERGLGRRESRAAASAGRVVGWAPDAEKELRRSRSSCAARRAATPSASPRSAAWPLITVETLYDAKAHFSR